MIPIKFDRVGSHRARDNVRDTEDDDCAAPSHIEVILLRGSVSYTFIKKFYRIAGSLIKETVLNRRELIKKMNEISSEVLREKGYISFIDILTRMGKLTKDDYEAWRFSRVPYLERVVSLNLSKLNFMLRTMHQSAKRGGLRPSKTVYVSWGKRPRKPLRFSKSGDPNIEEAYSTHFLKPAKKLNNSNFCTEKGIKQLPK